MNRAFPVIGIISSVFFVVAACTSRDGFDEPTPTPLVSPDADTPETVACGLHCSRDLKQVLTGCEGSETIVAQCNADQGCGNGQCVDACSAASLEKGSAGCDFWTVSPDSPIEGRGGCFAAMIANTWDRAVTLKAEFGPDTFDISRSTYTVARANDDAVYTLLDGPLPAGQVAVVFLAHDDTNHDEDSARCPASVTPAMLVDPLQHGTGMTKAFHISADAPVSAYSIYPYGGADTHYPTATLLLPVSSWTQNYVAVSPFDFGDTQRRRTLQIVANQDATDVTIKPVGNIAAGGDIQGAATGIAQTWTLQKGQVLQFLQAPLGGSPIETSKPVGVFGGAECTELPTPYCDTLQQQIPPFAQWGTEYAVVPYLPRVTSFSPDAREQVPYSLIGAADGTVLTYEPSRPLDAPETLSSGQVASFMTDQIFIVKSQDSKHPFHANVYMTGSTFGSGNGTRTTGDPDFVNVPPSDQFLDRYVFFTDFTFPDTTLTVVRRKTGDDFAPVLLECGGEITGWSPIGTSGKYEFAWVKLTSGFVSQKFAGGECTYGRQEAHSTGPFAVTVWGTGVDASYGYVGGVGLRPINDAVPPPVR